MQLKDCSITPSCLLWEANVIKHYKDGAQRNKNEQCGF